MVGKKMSLGMLIAVLTLVMTLLGCSNGSNDGPESDSRLIGLWTDSLGTELLLTDHTFEFLKVEEESSIPESRGNYSIRGSAITLAFNDYHGDYLKTFFNDEMGIEHDLSSRWYSRAQLVSFFQNYLWVEYEYTTEQIDEYFHDVLNAEFDRLFHSINVTYSFNEENDTLSILYVGADPVVHTRIPILF